MVDKKGKKPARRVKSLPAKSVSAKKAKSVKGGTFSFGQKSTRMPTAVE